MVTRNCVRAEALGLPSLRSELHGIRVEILGMCLLDIWWHTDDASFGNVRAIDNNPAFGDDTRQPGEWCTQSKTFVDSTGEVGQLHQLFVVVDFFGTGVVCVQFSTKFLICFLVTK